MNTGTTRNQKATELDSEVRRLVREMDQVWLRVGRLCLRCKGEDPQLLPRVGEFGCLAQNGGARASTLEDHGDPL